MGACYKAANWLFQICRGDSCAAYAYCRLNAFQHMLQKGDSRMFNLFFSSDSVRVVASAGTREHLAGNAGEAAAAAAASAAAAQAVASATAAATHDRSRRGSTSTRQHRQPQSRCVLSRCLKPRRFLLLLLLLLNK